MDRLVRRRVLPERRTRIGRLPHRLLDDRHARQSPQTPVEPGAPRRRREDHEAHARRQIRRPEEPRQADRQTVRDARRYQGHGPQGPALPRMATQGTIEDPAQTTGRPGQGRVETLGVLGLAFTHTRDRRTGEEDPTPPAGHPAHDPAGLLQRQARGLQQQDQGTIRMAYGCHHVNNLIALVMLRCGRLDIRLPQPRT